MGRALDWGVIAGLLREGYLEIAPRKLRDIAEGREGVTTARKGRR